MIGNTSLTIEDFKPWPVWVVAALDAGMPAELIDTVADTLASTTSETAETVSSTLGCSLNLYKSPWINKIRDHIANQ